MKQQRFTVDELEYTFIERDEFLSKITDGNEQYWIFHDGDVGVQNKSATYKCTIIASDAPHWREVKATMSQLNLLPTPA